MVSGRIKSRVSSLLERQGLKVMRTSIYPQKGRPILLAAMPKSGSNFLRSALESMTGARREAMRLDPEVQHFDPIRLIWAQGCFVTSKSHMIASDYAVTKINETKMRVIVLERRLSDVIVSMRDHMESEAHEKGEISTRLMITHFGIFPASYFSAGHSAQYDHLIDLLTPWLLTFYTSWRLQAKRMWRQPYFLRYTELFADPQARLKEISVYLDCEVDPVVLEAAAQRKDGVRLNVGRTGRGAELLSAEQMARIGKIVARLGGDPDAVRI